MNLSALSKEYKSAKKDHMEVFRDILGMNIDRPGKHFMERCDERGFDIRDITDKTLGGIRKNIRAIRWELKSDNSIDALMKVQDATVVVKIDKNSVPHKGNELGERALVTLVTVYSDNEQIPKKESGRIRFVS